MRASKALSCLLGFLLLLVSIEVQPAVAGTFGLTLKSSVATRARSPEELARARAFLADVERRLPERLKQKIERPIAIEFAKFDKEVFPTSDQFCAKVKAGTAPAMSKIKRTGLFGSRRIQLRPEFLAEIISGAGTSGAFSCGHNNYYETAVAAIVHQLSHFYDEATDLTPEETRLLWECREDEESGDYPGLRKGPSAGECAKLQARPARLSERAQFRRLEDWTDGYFPSKQSKTGNAHEDKSPGHNLAVDLERFLLDPEFGCRKPRLYEYFAKEFETRPFTNRQCQPSTSVYLDGSGQRVELDPKRVYQIQYLHAMPGKVLAAKWGHTMFRYVVCAPDRKVVGPECLEDAEHHLVVSYRANLFREPLNPLRAAFGGYPSQPFFFKWKDIEEDYGNVQLRDLVSPPLKLPRDVLERLTESTVERARTYHGDYKFFSENCATAGKDLLASALPDDHPFHDRGLLSPGQLLDALLETGLLEKKDLEANGKNPYWIKSMLVPRIEFAFSAARPVIPSKFKSLIDYFDRSTSDERMKIYEGLTPEQRKDYRLVYSLLILEGRVLAFQERRQAEEVQKVFQSKKFQEKMPVGFHALLKKYREALALTVPDPARRDPEEYGVPLCGSKAEQAETSAYESAARLHGQVFGVLQTEFPELKELQELNNQNISKLILLLDDAKKAGNLPR